MKNHLRLSLLAASLVALPFTGRAAEACCADKKADCKTTSASASASASCCASKSAAESVTLRLRKADDAALGQALASLEGVKGVHTCPDSKFTTVSFSKETACPDKVIAAVRKAGYRIQAQRLTFKVDGMACGACSDKVAKALAKVRGVSANHVCSESKTATVDFQPGRVSAEKVLAAIKAAGFEATESLN